MTVDGWAQASPIAKQAAVGSSLDVIAEYARASERPVGSIARRHSCGARSSVSTRAGSLSSRRRATSSSSRRRRSRRRPPRGSPRTRTRTTSSKRASGCSCSRRSGSQGPATAPATGPARSRPAACPAGAGPTPQTARPKEVRPGDFGSVAAGARRHRGMRAVPGARYRLPLRMVDQAVCGASTARAAAIAVSTSARSTSRCVTARTRVAPISVIRDAFCEQSLGKCGRRAPGAAATLEIDEIRFRLAGVDRDPGQAREAFGEGGARSCGRRRGGRRGGRARSRRPPR